MSISDPVGDMLAKLRNAGMAKHDKVDIPCSRLKLEIIKILKTEGYIRNFKKAAQDGIGVLRVFLKYDGDGMSVIHGMKKVSTPGRRVYTGYKTMPRVYNGFGTLIVSTSGGVITGKRAVEQNVGGEIICMVW